MWIFVFAALAGGITGLFFVWWLDRRKKDAEDAREDLWYAANIER
jgi:hypothetical protein